MGYYINEVGGYQLHLRGKAEEILRLIPGSELIDQPSEWRDGLVCVVDNGSFEAAAYAYSEHEMLYFISTECGRPKKWLFVPNARAYAR